MLLIAASSSSAVFKRHLPLRYVARRYVTSHEPCSPPRGRPIIAATSLMRRRRRSYLGCGSRRTLPPEDLAHERQSQGTKSRPFCELLAARGNASIAIAQITPMPAMVIIRFAVASWRALSPSPCWGRPVCLASEAICASNILQRPITTIGKIRSAAACQSTECESRRSVASIVGCIQGEPGSTAAEAAD